MVVRAVAGRKTIRGRFMKLKRTKGTQVRIYDGTRFHLLSRLANDAGISPVVARERWERAGSPLHVKPRELKWFVRPLHKRLPKKKTAEQRYFPGAGMAGI